MDDSNETTFPVINATIQSIFLNHNYIPYGAYENIIQDIPTLSFPKDIPTQSRRFKRKTWFFIGGYSKDWYVGLAIVDAGYLAKAFCYIYDTKNKKLIEDEITVPFGFEKNFDPGFNNTWKIKNYSIVASENKVIAEVNTKKFTLKIDLKNNTAGISCFCPSETKRPFHYTYKNLLLDGAFELKINGRSKIYQNMKFGLDFSKGFPPRHTFWNWASFQGKCEDGKEVGINLVDGFNSNLENIIWYANNSILTKDVKFSYSKPLDKSNWHVSNQELELTLTPQGARNENINLLIIKSKFTQVFGEINGKFLIDGYWKKITGFGVMEEHEAKW